MEKEKHIITRKIEVYINEEDKKLKDEYWNLLKDYAFKSRLVANMSITEYYFMDNLKRMKYYMDEEKAKKLMRELTPEEKEIGTNTSPQNVGYRVVSKNFKGELPSSSYSMICDVVFKNYNKKKNEIFTGQSSLPNYKRNFPIKIPAASFSPFKYIKEKKNFSFTTLNRLPFITRLGRDRSDNRTILHRIISGEYSIGGSDIKLHYNPQTKETKIYLYLTVKMPVQKTDIVPGRALGMNLGLVNPAVVCTNHNQNAMFIGSADELFHRRRQIQETRKRLQRSLRYANGGKGRGKKLKSLDQYRQYEHNYVTTKNHQYSRIIVDHAIKNRCEFIYIEDFQGIAKDKSYFSKIVLRNWSYYQLQEFITCKAKAAGIKIQIINPAKMSQKCKHCGHIHPENRVGLQEFKCTNCQKQYKADYLHAWNVARATKEQFKKKKDHQDSEQAL